MGLWALDANLAHQRQFPAIDWETSYSLYTEATAAWFVERVAADWPELRRATLELLQRETEVLDIAGLVGPETLQDPDRLVLDAARVVREMVLGQNAYDPDDAASPLAKTYQLARLAHALYEAARKALEAGAKYEDLDLRPATTAMASARSAPEQEFEVRVKQVEDTIAAIIVPAAGTPGRGGGMTLIPPRTYHGAHGAGGPLLYLRNTKNVSFGEWVTLRSPGQPARRGQVIDAGDEVTVIQVLEDTLGLPPARTEITLTGDTAMVTVGRELLGRAFSGVGVPIDGLPESPSARTSALSGALP